MGNISVYKSSSDPKPVLAMPIDEFLANVKNGTYIDVVNKVRDITDKDARQEFKQKNLPAVTISGAFTYRNQKNLIEHSGFIDKKANRVIYHSASALKRNTIVEIAHASFWKDYFKTDNGGVTILKD